MGNEKLTMNVKIIYRDTRAFNVLRGRSQMKSSIKGKEESLGICDKTDLEFFD